MTEPKRPSIVDETWEFVTPWPDCITPSRRVEGHSGSVRFPRGGGMHVKFDPANSSMLEGAERGRLAAAAPDMARVLLAIEWVDTSGEYQERCPSCQCRTELPPDGRVGALVKLHPGEHSASCELVAALRKAGLR